MMRLLRVFIFAAVTTSIAGAPSPGFGHGLISNFYFEENSTMFNHGSYGGVPRPVLAAQFGYVTALEKFVIDRIDGAWYRDRLLALRKRVAKYINAAWEDTVIVDNASNAINLLLSSWQFAPNEVILDFSTAYGPFKAYYEYLNATRGVATVTVPIAFPVSGPEEILDALKSTLAALKASGRRAGVCVLSQVSSAPAILLPAKEIITLLKAEGVPTILDGAHAIGATPVDVVALGSPAFWFGNAHKWLFAPRSACVLYVSKAFQGPYWPEPTVVDSFGDGFADRFVWSGTRDRSAFLAIDDAMDYREWAGGGGAAGEAATMRYLNELSHQGAELLVEAWGTGLMAPHAMQAAMHNVIVPTGLMRNASAAAACAKVGDELRETYRVQLFALMEGGVCYVRVMAMIYLELDDYRRLAKQVVGILGGAAPGTPAAAL